MAKDAKNTEVVSVKELPNLHNLEASYRELSSEYWTPTIEGEYKVGVVLEIKTEVYENADGVKIDLPCVIILSQNDDLTFTTIRNGSKRLVATIENSIESGAIQYGQTPVRITFKGEEKNKTNNFKSARWSIKSLVI